MKKDICINNKNNNKIEKIFKIIYYFLFIFIILVAVLLILSKTPFTNYKIFIVQSGSMEPTIKTGSIVIVRAAPEYKKGDIITFGKISKNKIPTTHRILEIKKYPNNKIAYITKGDANNSADMREVNKKNVIGKVIFSILYLGYILVAVKTPLGFFSVIIIPAFLIIFDETKKIKQEIKKIKNK